MSSGAPDLSFDAAVAFAADLIRIPGPPGGEEAVAARVVEEMRRLGFDEVGTDEVGNAIAIARGDGRAAPVLLSCHLDVVDAGDPGGWAVPPYGGVVADGFLHGRGAMDIKGPLALQTYAAARVAARGSLPGDLVVAHTVFEERGGWGMAHLVDRLPVRPGVAVIGEATGGDICIGHRGRAELEIEVRGLAGHASAPDRARNALDGATLVLAALRRLPDARLRRTDPVLGRASLVATGIETTPSSPNVIPDRAVITVDWRVLPDMSAQEGLALVRGFLADEVELPEGLTLSVDYATERQRSWTGLEVDWEMFGPGFLVPPDHPLVRTAAAAVERATGERPAVRPWAFATDGRHTCGEHGIPTLGYAPGEEDRAHTNTERLDLSAARRAYEAYPVLIEALLAALAAGG